MNKIKQNSAITLIALVITIIVLLILAGLTLTFVLGENGLFGKARKAKEDANAAQAVEDIQLKLIEAQTEGLGNLTWENFLKALNNSNDTYLVKTASSQTSTLSSDNNGITDITGLNNHTTGSVYVTNLTNYKFEVEIGSDFKIKTVPPSTSNTGSTSGGTSSGGGSGTGGGSVVAGCSRYIKVNITHAAEGKMTLNVNIPETDNIKTIHYYVDNNEVYNGTQKSYTVTNLQNERTYSSYAIVEYENTKEVSEAKIQTYPEADIYVASTGNDSTGDGTVANPYATIGKAVTEASSTEKTSIFICPGEYNLPKVAANYYSNVGVYDMGKELEIFGANEQTVLYYDSTSSAAPEVGERQSDDAVVFDNDNSVLRNLTYIFKPKHGENYAKAVWGYNCYGYTKNVFFRFIGNDTVSYDYGAWGAKIENCTFYHDKGSVDTNYNGNHILFSNIASNVTVYGNTNTDNIQIQSFGSATDSLATLIQNNKNNQTFNTNEAGVFHGDYAWE